MLIGDLIHDLNQSLSIIEGSAHLIGTYSGDPRIDLHVEIIRRQVQEAARVLAAATNSATSAAT